MPDLIQIEREVAQSIIRALQAALDGKHADAAPPKRVQAKGQANHGAAGSYEMPFGKHKGRTLNQILAEDDGRGYLEYLLDWDQLKDHTRAKITAVLSGDGGTRSAVDELPPGDDSDSTPF